MEHIPHLLIEGIITSSYAIGSSLSYIYIRGEFAWIVEILEQAIAEAKNNGWLGKNILGSGFDCEIYVQDLKEKHLSSGVYSILNNEWIIKPEKTTQNIDENKILEKTEEYSKKINNLATKLKNKENIDKDLLDLKRKIKRFRQSGLDTGGEYSYENLTFKMLRRNGSIKMLLDLQTTNTNNKLSITQ